MRELVSLNIAIVAVGEAPTQAVVDRLGGAGHVIVQHAQLDDVVQVVRGKLLEHIADAGIDVVIVVAGLKTDSAGAALQPLVTRSLTGFRDLLQMIAFQEIGSAAMLVDAEAAQCKSTFVFVLPANVSAIKLALERLIVPQLDYRTKPRNIVMALPRIAHADSDTDEAPDTAAAAPWITTRGPGDAPVPSMFPPRPSAQMPNARKSIQMASVADVVEQTAASVSARVPAPTPGLGVGVVSAFGKEATHQGPPPVPPRPTRTLPPQTIPAVAAVVRKPGGTISAPLPHKAPAVPQKVVALSPLLPEPVSDPEINAALLAEESSPGIDVPAPEVAAPSDASVDLANAEAAAAAEAAAIAEAEAVDAAKAAAIAEAAAVAAGNRTIRPGLSGPINAPLEAPAAAEPEAVAAQSELSLTDAVPTPVTEDIGSAPGARTSNGINGHVNGSARKLISLADLEAEDRDAADDSVAELDGDVAEIVDSPKQDESRGMIVRSAHGSTPPDNATSGVIGEISRAATSDDATTTPRRVVTASTPPDDEPRRYAEPPRRKKSGRLALLLIGVFAFALVSVALVLFFMRHDGQPAQAAPDPDMPSPREEIATTKEPPVGDEPPAANPSFGQTPTEAAATGTPATAGTGSAAPVADPPAEDPPAEIDMGTPDPNAPVTTNPAAAKTPKPPRTPPKESIEKPAQDPADVLATAPVNAKTEDGCDEVSCILDKYKQACCAKFKPADPEPVAEKPASGLPGKLDKLMVQEGIAGVKPAVIACGENNGIHGTVKLQVRVSPSGKPLDVAVATTPDAALGKCVAAAVKLAKFTETDEGGSFGYPFLF